LLIKAVSIHGKPGEMSQSPLKNREVAAYRSLEEWVRITLANNPELHEKAGVPISASVATERNGARESVAIVEAADHRQPGAPKDDKSEAATPFAAPTSAEPVDPYDPVIFNRQMHPK
jgi:hypothetical protein